MDTTKSPPPVIAASVYSIGRPSFCTLTQIRGLTQSRLAGPGSPVPALAQSGRDLFFLSAWLSTCSFCLASRSGYQWAPWPRFTIGLDFAAF
jgi:hypothetical protein